MRPTLIGISVVGLAGSAGFATSAGLAGSAGLATSAGLAGSLGFAGALLDGAHARSRLTPAANANAPIALEDCLRGFIDFPPIRIVIFMSASPRLASPTSSFLNSSRWRARALEQCRSTPAEHRASPVHG